ncbi:hypothetical protein [Streptomyces sp. NBC_01497]|uniref:hypothetical protein n=1 Tax=Streptomyces sp. NBC_01497 TaxID=2903885 RepID=UPI002E2F588A|nr:hypothetical protein [Streptomyces sp. NBC_01497]
MAEVDAVLLLAVRQPGVRPFSLGEPFHESAGIRERGAGLLTHDQVQQYALPAAAGKRDDP